MTDPSHPGILFVDDEPMVVSALARIFRSRRQPIFTASTPAISAQLLCEHEIGVIVCEPRHVDLAEFLIEARDRYPGIVRIVLTAYPNLTSVVKAFNQARPFKLMFKPCDDDEMLATISLAFEQYAINRKRDVLIEEYDYIRSLARRNHAFRVLDALMLSLPATISLAAIDALPVGTLLIRDGAVVLANAQAQRFLAECDPSPVVQGAAVAELPADMASLLCAPRALHLSHRVGEHTSFDYFVMDVLAGTLIAFAPPPRAGPA